MILKLRYAGCIELIPTTNIVRIEITMDDDEDVWVLFVLKELAEVDLTERGNYKTLKYVGKRNKVNLDVLEELLVRILSDTSSNVVDFDKLIKEKVRVERELGGEENV